MQFSTFFLAALSMGSAIAGPLASVQVFNTAVSAFAQAENVVQEQQAQISRLTKEAPNAENTIKIQQCLLIVGQTVNGLFKPAADLSGAGSAPLPEAQLHSVPKFADSFLSIIVNIQAIGKTVTGLHKDQLALLQPELQLALAPIAPLARPIFAYIEVAAPSQAKAFHNYAHPLLNIQALLKLVVDLEINLNLDISIGLGIFI